MSTYATCSGPSCSRSLVGRHPDARYCTGRCRAAAHRARHREAEAAREEALRLLLAHGEEIRAAIGEDREPDRARLDSLAAAMDAATLRAEDALRR